MKTKKTFGCGLLIGLITGIVITMIVIVLVAHHYIKGLKTPPTVDIESVFTLSELLALVEECPAEVGFYGKNLTTGLTIEHRPDQPACLASIVKIFTLLEVMRQVDRGDIQLSDALVLPYKAETKNSTIGEALDLMIGKSDNIATDTLTAMVGHDRVNSLPEEIGITGLSEKTLPEPGVLGRILDKRVYAAERLAPLVSNYPQHGTARAVSRYFEILHENRLLSHSVSEDVLAILNKNPKATFVSVAPPEMTIVGKGGGCSWKRPGKPQYNMMGWALYLYDDDTALSLCIWCEWFPENMGEDSRWRWTQTVSDSIVNVLLERQEKESSQQPDGEATQESAPSAAP